MDSYKLIDLALGIKMITERLLLYLFCHSPFKSKGFFRLWTLSYPIMHPRKENPSLDMVLNVEVFCDAPFRLNIESSEKSFRGIIR